MLFDETFLESILGDPVAAVISICNEASRATQDSPDWTRKDYEALSEAYILLSEMAEAGILPVDFQFTPIDQSQTIKVKCATISEQLSRMKALCIAEADQTRLQRLRSRFKTTLGSSFRYEFSQGDLERMQMLINNLRGVISTTAKLEASHQSRLLKRLEQLQSELHKKISDLDRFWGLIGDAGVVLAKLGNDAKPIVDRVREIADIVWQTQSRAEELPSGTKLPQIGHDSNDAPSDA